MFAMSHQIFERDALVAFEACAFDIDEAEVGNHNLCLQAVTKHVFPQHALQY